MTKRNLAFFPYKVNDEEGPAGEVIGNLPLVEHSSVLRTDERMVTSLYTHAHK
ncbi:MAG: hypothetical protein Q6356_005920 [Candidatus Wukongarchaeota archaeon]|nr:hypothetical protein [Candidatus Wukongarchaeota archaeon]